MRVDRTEVMSVEQGAYSLATPVFLLLASPSDRIPVWHRVLVLARVNDTEVAVAIHEHDRHAPVRELAEQGVNPVPESVVANSSAKTTVDRLNPSTNTVFFIYPFLIQVIKKPT